MARNGAVVLTKIGHWIADRIWAGKPARRGTSPGPGESPDDGQGPVRIRRWDAAVTSRLNATQWSDAHGAPINVDILSDLPTLWARCAYEIQQNPIVEGVINTHCLDVVGRDGPQLQVQSDDSEFNAGVEEDWDDVFENPEESGMLGGPDLLQLWVRQWWYLGEYVNQQVTIERMDSDANFGWRVIDPKRLPVNNLWPVNQRTAFSIEYDERDRPVQYWIYPVDMNGEIIPGDPRGVPADLVNHVFKVHEPGQRRGVPWLAVALQVIADVRDHDKHVMLAAKNAAAQAIYWYTEHPECDINTDVVFGQTHQLKYSSQTIGPSGWKPAMLQPTQPTAMYKEHRHERLRELGRPACMPLMVVLLSSADSNFASAHYDGQVYMRALDGIQGFLARKSLNPAVKTVAFVWCARRGRSMPRRWRCHWTWPRVPYVNPKQMYDALRQQLEDGTASYSDVLAALGRDLDTTIDRRVRDSEALQAAKLPPLPQSKNIPVPGMPPAPGASPPVAATRSWRRRRSGVIVPRDMSRRSRVIVTR